MNRLKLMRFYLVGPMDNDREGGRQWREMISDWLLERSAIPLNPYEKPLRNAETAAEDDNNFFARQKAKAEGDWRTVRELMKPVVHTDLRMVDHCDALIVHLDLDKKPCGTWDEIVTAANQNKPVLIHAVQGIKELPDWLFGRLHYDFFFNDWYEMKGYLDYINTEPDETLHVNEPSSLKWKFFDYEPLVKEALSNV
ncbi:hypothetical protein DRO61_07970 [Candidatus Bathyarchaeota archaeon]|nr:MAG: hypothetical protein DRO61_07970 [Candidatus Bathyarchaeota archaeon]